MKIAGPWKLISVTAMPIMGSPRTTVASSSILWAPIPCAYSWPPLGPCGSLPPVSSMPTWRCNGFGHGTVTRWPQVSLTWRGLVGKPCKRREFFPYLGFSPLWPKISKRLIHQNPLRLKAKKLMTRCLFHKYTASRPVGATLVVARGWAGTRPAPTGAGLTKWTSSTRHYLKPRKAAGEMYHLSRTSTGDDYGRAAQADSTVVDVKWAACSAAGG